MAQNPSNFHPEFFFLNFKRVLEDMKTRFFICMWFLKRLQKVSNNTIS